MKRLPHYRASFQVWYKIPGDVSIQRMRPGDSSCDILDESVRSDGLLKVRLHYRGYISKFKGRIVCNIVRVSQSVNDPSFLQTTWYWSRDSKRDNR